MDDLIIEQGSFGANPSPKDLARHLFTRMSCGKVVIIAENPEVMKAVLRKQWLKLARKVQRERSSTLNATRLLRLGDMAIRMQSVKFQLNDERNGDIFIISAERLYAFTTGYRTLYITCHFEPEFLEAMRRKTLGGVIIICRLV